MLLWPERSCLVKATVEVRDSIFEEGGLNAGDGCKMMMLRYLVTAILPDGLVR